ncbi:hypothetical protein P7C71_g925, partial [Lecanoromycetidae sp. Uapishka_2]
MLDTILRAFIRGLNDTTIRKEATRGMAASDRSLKNIYSLAEEARRTNIEIQKLWDKEVKSDELHFYKKLAQTNIPQNQIDTLLTSYHIAKTGGQPGPINQPSTWVAHDTYRPPLQESSNNRQRPPSYTSERPSGQRDQQDSGTKDTSTSRFAKPEPTPKELPDRSLSKNPWINGTLHWSYNKDGQLYGFYDGNLKPYGTTSKPTTIATVAGSSSIDAYVDPTPRSQALSYNLSSLYLDKASNSKLAIANYGKGSAPNKRPHMEDGALAPLAPQPPLQPQQDQLLQPFQFQSATRQKAKGQKRVGKKAEPQPLVGMFNETIGKYDAPISIRWVLQNNKVDITWMDFVAWSPAVCKELKRLCTRVAKKRIAKPKVPAGQQQFQPTFQQQAPQMPATLPQFQPVPQVFQPQVFQPAQQQQQQFTQAPAGPPQFVQAPVPQQMQPQQMQPLPGQQAQPSQPDQLSVTTVLAADAEKHTRFLSNLVGVDKAFRIPAMVSLPDGTQVGLDRKLVQGDQGSDMNVISAALARQLKLELKSVEEVGFKGLSMRTADQKDTLLHYWVWLRITVEHVTRDIRCFVTPDVTSTTSSGGVEHLSLILGLPWLYSVDAVILIRQSKIMIGDATTIMAVPKSAGKVVEVHTEDEEEEESSDESESEDDLSNIDDNQPFR